MLCLDVSEQQSRRHQPQASLQNLDTVLRIICMFSIVIHTALCFSVEGKKKKGSRKGLYLQKSARIAEVSSLVSFRNCTRLHVTRTWMESRTSEAPPLHASSLPSSLPAQGSPWLDCVCPPLVSLTSELCVNENTHACGFVSGFFYATCSPMVA